MANKPSNIQKVGKFIIDDIKQATKKTVAVAPFVLAPEIKAGGIAGKIVSKIVAKAVAKHGSDAVKVGEDVGKALAEHLKKPVVEAKSAQVVNVKPLQGTPSRVTSTTGSNSIGTSTKNISYVKPGRSEAQAAKSQQGLQTARQNTLNVGKTSGTNAAINISAKAATTGVKAGAKATGLATIPVIGAAAKIGYNAGKKKSGK